MNKIILIGGAPTTGKTYLARFLSEKYKLPWISTDTIRGQMKKVVNKKDYKYLFDLDESTITAESYLNSRTAQEIVDEQNLEGVDVWQGVKALLDTDYSWKSYIIEGVAIIPKLVSEYKNKKLDIKPIFIVDNNTKWTKNVVYKRGLWDDAKTYSDEVKPKEIEWVLLYNKYIISECKKYGFSTHEILDRNHFLEVLSQEIEEWLKKM